MTLTTKSAWALLDDAQRPKEPTVRITAIRGFWQAGVLVRPGDSVEVPESVAQELMTNNKATVAPDEPPTAKELSDGTATTETDSSQVPQDVQSVD